MIGEQPTMPAERLSSRTPTWDQRYGSPMTPPQAAVRPIDSGEVDVAAAVLARSLPSTMRAFGTRLPRALSVVLSAEKVHPDEPHRHLAYIGTHSDHKGKGLGSALIRSMLDRCDEQGIPTYLESTNPANDAWYASFGFESRGPIPLPKGAPVITSMWRDAR